MKFDALFPELVLSTAAQVEAFERRERSRAEKHYADAMKEAATTLSNIIRIASFDQLIAIEKMYQKNDLDIYAKVPATQKSVQQGIDDLQDGEDVYRQLQQDPQAYKAHKYRTNEKAPPDKLVPLDAMRRALRGQIKRVENYRKNVMGNPHEHTFLSARIALLHRAEKMYNTIQRDAYTPSERS